MQYPSYSFNQTADATQFFFESIGPKGVIQKIVSFTPTLNTSIYNLALGDLDPSTGHFDDLTVSNNGDTTKILATIVHILCVYMDLYPYRSIVFAGNSSSRNRLYRIAINQAYPELAETFSLFGYQNGDWENFEANQPYELFLIALK